jgi:flagellar biosynthesis protein FlhF
MRIKKYEATDIKEAIRMIKADFGSDAVILHSRTINKGGLFGMMGKEMVEVMAGTDINIVEENEKSIASPIITPLEKATPEAKSRIIETPYTPKIKEKNQVLPITIGLEKKVNFLKKEMEDVKDTLQIIVKKVANSPHPMISPRLLNYYKGLEQMGIGEDLIVSLLQDVEVAFKGDDLDNSDQVLKFIKDRVVDLLGVPHPVELDNGRKIIALVGPTGVGKTTTIAKMAANFSLIEKKQVALITIDTFRIAAIEQLKSYANIIGIPMEVVFGLEDFSRALRKFKMADVILIDTAGRSPKNNSQIVELKKFIKSNFMDIHLVLSVTTKSKDIYKAISRYDVLGGDKVIFTKVDETDASGVMVDVVKKYGKKLTYFTNGQNVPDDFELAYGNKLADIMFSDVKMS